MDTGPGAGLRFEALSDDPRFVAFSITAPNLIPGQIDGNNANHVFVYDRQSGHISLVSHKGDGVTTANRDSSSPVIRGAGNKVAFMSRAADLVAGFADGNDSNTQDLFVYDVASGDVSLVSHTGDGVSSGNDTSGFVPSISDDGSRIVYSSQGANLVPGSVDNNGNSSDVFLYETSTGDSSVVRSRTC